jgi:hypothetical protein
MGPLADWRAPPRRPGAVGRVPGRLAVLRAALQPAGDGDDNHHLIAIAIVVASSSRLTSPHLTLSHLTSPCDCHRDAIASSPAAPEPERHGWRGGGGAVAGGGAQPVVVPIAARCSGAVLTQIAAAGVGRQPA